MQLDPVRRDPSLPVQEIEERDPDHHRVRWFNSGRGHPSSHRGFFHRAGVSDHLFVSAVVRSRPLEKGADWRTTGARRRLSRREHRGQMGHSSITLTLDRYGHLFPGNEDEAAGLLDAYLAR
jgi:hypothetical protein